MKKYNNQAKANYSSKKDLKLLKDEILSQNLLFE